MIVSFGVSPCHAWGSTLVGVMMPRTVIDREIVERAACGILV